MGSLEISTNMVFTILQTHVDVGAHDKPMWTEHSVKYVMLVTVFTFTVSKIFILDKYRHLENQLRFDAEVQGFWNNNKLAAVLKYLWYAAVAFRTLAAVLAMWSVISGLVFSMVSDACMQVYLSGLNIAKSSTEVQTTLFAQGFAMLFVPLQYWLVHESRVATELAFMFLVYRVLVSASLGQTPCDGIYYFTRIGQLEPKDVTKEELGKMIAEARLKNKKPQNVSVTIMTPSSDVGFVPVSTRGGGMFEIGGDDDEDDFKVSPKIAGSQEMTRLGHQPSKKKQKKKNGPEFDDDAAFGDFQSNQPDIESSAF
eukprot:TRINITY_DN5138_c0_g1_i1.p1 TRINITY_DN5138_c0_g1~~TRINITY_DN5138_c0_g1_i1.p1  ORF type:complete len:360 (-),score=77.36 TRINITY_DN5138_c0_g1_i1:56-991(-)